MLSHFNAKKSKKKNLICTFSKNNLNEYENNIPDETYIVK